MRWKCAVLTLAGIIWIFGNSATHADVKAAAGVLKSTVAIEWSPEVPADQKQGKLRSRTPKSTEAKPGTAPAAVEDGEPPPPTPGPLLPKSLIATADGQLLAAYAARLTGTPKPEVSDSATTSGSGVVVDANGLIVTSLTTGNGGKFSVTLEDGRKLSATRVVFDQRSGLLLLKVDAKELSAVQLCIDPLEVGQDVLGGMCAEQNSRSLRRGIITGKNRTVHGPCAELIQSDVPGWDSMPGAPLVNEAGQLIGIFTRPEEPPVRGLSYAIPARFVKLLLESRPAQGQFIIRKGFLGVQLGHEEGVDDNVVAKVFEDSPAAKSGIREKDHIIQIDGTAIATPADVVRAVSQHKGGDKITITYQRDGKEEKAEVTLSDFPERSDQPVAVNVVQPPQVLVLTPDGRDLKLAPQYLLPREKPDTTAGQPPKATSSRVAEALAERYTRALYDGATENGTLRVERSDLNQKLDELKNQVDALKTEVSKLNKVLEQLEKKLSP